MTTNYTLKRLKLQNGDKFKYVFDFGEEWRFQCKILRELEEKTDIPGVIRSVGDPPVQYEARFVMRNPDQLILFEDDG